MSERCEYPIFETLVSEAYHGGGTNPTLERWLARARAGLAELRAEARASSRRRALDEVARALERAEELLHERRAEGARS